jgi:hypothetical protein
MRPVDDSFGHWLAGFIDGEGCFLISGKREGRLACAACVKLRGDDRPILDEIVERTGIGSVRHQPNTQRTHPQYAWLVNNKADCLALVALLDRFPLRAKKARDYAIWREGVLDWTRVDRRRGRSDWSRMSALKAALEAGRKFGADAVDVPEPAPVAQLRLAE